MRLTTLARGSYRLVDAVAEAHQLHAVVARFDFLDELRNLRHRPDLVQHPQHRFVGAAVQRTVQRRRRAGQGRVRVHMRAADRPHRRRAAVLLVVGVQDEQDIQRPRQHRVGLILQLGHLEQHVQEVAGEAEVVVGGVVGTADAVAEGVGGDARDLRDEALRLLAAAIPGRRSVLGVGIERRERADGAQEDPHRMRVVAEALHELLDVLVQHGVERDVPHPGLLLLRATAARRTGSDTPFRGSRCPRRAVRLDNRDRAARPCRRRCR